MLKAILATNFPTKSLLKMSKFCWYIFDKEDITHRFEDDFNSQKITTKITESIMFFLLYIRIQFKNPRSILVSII